VTNDECHIKWRKLEYQTCHVKSCFIRVIELNQKMLILKRFVTKSVFLLPVCPLWIVRPLPPATPLSHLCDPSMLPGVEVSHPKTINIKQYLSTWIDKRHILISMLNFTSPDVLRFFHNDFLYHQTLQVTNEECHLSWRKQYLSTDNFSVNNRNGCHQIFTNNTTLYYKSNL
jgi:hypothetical protein